MISKIIIASAFLAITSSIPVDHHDGATSFVSLSFGNQNQPSYQNPQYQNPQYQNSQYQYPVYIQKQVQPAPALIKVPTYTSSAYNHQEEEYGPAQYEFQYSVEDKHTGDIKSQHEVRNGDAVQGEYSLHEADGTVRVVKYTADKHNGFNAVVERKGQAAHPEVVPVKAVHAVQAYDYYKH